MIDMGGGSGSYTLAFLNASADIQATLFDLPEVIEMAKEHIQEARMMDRLTLTPGDFYQDALIPARSQYRSPNSHEQPIYVN